MRQPVLHHGRVSAWSYLAYTLLCGGLAIVAFAGLSIGGLVAALLWLPGVILAAIGAAVFLLLNPRRNWSVFRNWWERHAEAAFDAAAHVSTSVTLLAERYAERDGGGFFLTMGAGRLCDGRREPVALSLRDDRHVTMIAGNRAGKGRSIILPNLARWRGSVIVNDPAGELVTISAAHRRTMGQRIVVLDPFKVTGADGACWNPFDEIRTTDPFLIEKARLIAESLIEHTGGDRYWVDAARGLLVGVILHVLTAAPPEARNLHTMRTLLTDESPEAVWHVMQQNDALDGLVRQAGAENATREPREIMSALQTARVATDWLDSPAMRRMIARSTFRMTDLKREKVSLYLVLPPGRGATFSKWLRLLFDMAFDALQEPGIPKPDEEILFVLDEFPLLGNMERIKRAAGEAAKFGVKLFVIAQDVNQLKEIYGEAWETFIANSFLTIMFGTNDLTTQNYASQRAGQGWFDKVVTTFSSGKDGGSTSTAHSRELQSIARPDQIAGQGAREGGRAYFFVAGQKPWLLPRANHDEWGMFPPVPASPTRAAGAWPAPPPSAPATCAARGTNAPCPAVARFTTGASNG